MNSFNWLDMLVILVLLIYALDGLLKGLILSVFKAAGFFISIYIARLAAPVFSNYISQNTNIYNEVYNFLTPKLSVDSSTAAVFNAVGIKEDGLYSKATDIFIAIAALILVFILIRIILLFAVKTLNMTAKIPVIKQFNKIGGFCFGIVKGVLILYIVFAVLVLLTPVLPADNVIISAADNSLFAVNFYKYNFLVQWIGNFFS